MKQHQQVNNNKNENIRLQAWTRNCHPTLQNLHWLPIQWRGDSPQPGLPAGSGQWNNPQTER